MDSSPHPTTKAEVIFERFSEEERLCILYSLRCNIECAHCNVSSSPRRTERLTLDEAMAVLRDCAGVGKKHVTFSGGEVFLFYDDLAVLVAESARLGYEVDIETNAYFASTPERAETKLRPLAESGLRGMCLSTDAYHLDFFGLDRQINAYRVGVSLGLLMEVNFCPSTRQEVDDHIRETLVQEGIPFLENSILNRGRARDSSLVSLGTRPDGFAPCDSLNATVHPSGDVFACCAARGGEPADAPDPGLHGESARRAGLSRRGQQAGEAGPGVLEPGLAGVLQAPAGDRAVLRGVEDEAVPLDLRLLHGGAQRRGLPVRRPGGPGGGGRPMTAPEVAGARNRNELQEGVCFEVPNEAKVDFLLTFRCNAACAHCITQSNPHRTERLEYEEVVAVLEAGAEMGKRWVNFTGGEPFTEYAMLRKAVADASRLGYFVACDTNAYWGRSRERARRTVAEMREAGLNALFPSADSYHLPWIPVASVLNVVQECESQGLTCEVNFYPGPDRKQDEEILEAMGLQDRGFFCDGLSLTGNDVSAFVHLFPQKSADELTDIGSMHLAISPRGDAYANVDVSYEGKEYVGTPFLVGNLRTEGARTVLEKELGSPTLSLARVAPPRDVHRRFLDDPELGEAYGGEFGERRYYSPTEYWLALFKSPLSDRLGARLEQWGREL